MVWVTSKNSGRRDDEDHLDLRIVVGPLDTDLEDLIDGQGSKKIISYTRNFFYGTELRGIL